MPSERLRVLLDSLGPVSDTERARLNAPAAGRSSADNPLGLRHLRGARVVDLVSGMTAVVQYGDRDPQTNVERYRVQLADASVQYRTRDQLEPAPAGSGR
jgi:hypothetical protein